MAALNSDSFSLRLKRPFRPVVLHGLQFKAKLLGLKDTMANPPKTCALPVGLPRHLRLWDIVRAMQMGLENRLEETDRRIIKPWSDLSPCRHHLRDRAVL